MFDISHRLNLRQEVSKSFPVGSVNSQQDNSGTHHDKPYIETDKAATETDKPERERRGWE